MREVRRKDRARDEAFAWEQVDRAPYGLLSMIDTDGMPYAVALDMAREGKYIYFHSALEGKKVEALKNNNKVCVVFIGYHRLAPESFTHKYDTAIVHGYVEEITDHAEQVRIMRDVMVQKLAPDNPRAKTRDYDSCIIPTGIWRITVEEIHGKSNAEEVKH